MLLDRTIFFQTHSQVSKHCTWNHMLSLYPQCLRSGRTLTISHYLVGGHPSHSLCGAVPNHERCPWSLFLPSPLTLSLPSLSLSLSLSLFSLPSVFSVTRCRPPECVVSSALTFVLILTLTVVLSFSQCFMDHVTIFP